MQPTLVLLLALLLLPLAAHALPPGGGGCGDAAGSARLTLRVLGVSEGLVAAAPEYVGEAWCPRAGGPVVLLEALLDLEEGALRVNFSFSFEAPRVVRVNVSTVIFESRVSMLLLMEGGVGLLRYHSEAGNSSVALEARLTVEPRGLAVKGRASSSVNVTTINTRSLEALLSWLLHVPVKLERVEQLDGVVYFEALAPPEALAEATMLDEGEALELLRSLRGGLEFTIKSGVQGLRAEAHVDLSFDPGLAAKIAARRLEALGFNASLSGVAELGYTVNASAGEVRVEARLRGPVIEAPSLWEAVRLAAEAVKGIAWSTGYEPLLLGRTVADALTPGSVEVVYPNGSRLEVPFPGAAEERGTSTIYTVTVTGAPATPSPYMPGAPAAAAATVTETVTETMTVTSTVTRTAADPEALGAAAAAAAVAASAATLLLSRRQG
ncbi:MAG: hypothetical protein GXO15_00605 [Crenarchaeota archaeon]|nr:hypothetical protein [Thermoproteota archaeon]